MPGLDDVVNVIKDATRLIEAFLVFGIILMLVVMLPGVFKGAASPSNTGGIIDNTTSSLINSTADKLVSAFTKFSNIPGVTAGMVMIVIVVVIIVAVLAYLLRGIGQGLGGVPVATGA